VVTALSAVVAVLGLFTASIPPAGSLRSDPGPPVEFAPETDAGAARLERMREQLADARQRVEAARQKLAAPRERVQWRLAAAGPATSAASHARASAPEPAPAHAVFRWPAKPRTIADVARATVLSPDAPLITGISQGRGRAGKRIVIDGRGFGGASHVVFAAAGGSGPGWVEAPFRVRDDARLTVTVPDMGALERLVAVAVVTPKGAAVTLPDEAVLVSAAAPAPWDSRGGKFYFVAAAGSLEPPRGAPVVVDRGAWARTPAASLVVIRAGGGVEKATMDCLIIRETDRPEPRDLRVTPVLDVRAVNVCFVDAPFEYSGR